ncbi:nucleolar and coiled-body phosphoprotein 1 [Periplaneta americana]|uniref:nucleolar and coiled-body phosphoprotein 1 n=1 Tax=Periplaneta americana TaxID=6978 RepID=UPI0037E7BD8B
MGGNSNNKKSSPSEFSEEAVRRVMVEALKDPGMLQVLTQAIRTAIVEDLKQTIAENSAVIESLKTALEKKDRHIRQLQMKVDDLEQYQRRQCLRIFGVSENGNDVVCHVIRHAACIRFTISCRLSECWINAAEKPASLYNVTGSRALATQTSMIVTGSTAAQPNLLQRACHGAWERFEYVGEQVASCPLGQIVFRGADRILWTVESTVKWFTEDDKESQQNGSTSAPCLKLPPDQRLVRPLPWVLFLPLLIWMRIAKLGIEVVAYLRGKEPLRASQVVRYIQIRRRRLRSLKYVGLKNFKSWQRSEQKKKQAEGYTILHATLFDPMKRLATFTGVGRIFSNFLDKSVPQEFNEEHYSDESSDDSEDIIQKINRMCHDYFSDEDSDYEPNNEFDESLSSDENEVETTETTETQVPTATTDISSDESQQTATEPTANEPRQDATTFPPKNVHGQIQQVEPNSMSSDPPRDERAATNPSTKESNFTEETCQAEADSSVVQNNQSKSQVSSDEEYKQKAKNPMNELQQAINDLKTEEDGNKAETEDSDPHIVQGTVAISAGVKEENEDNMDDSSSTISLESAEACSETTSQTYYSPISSSSVTPEPLSQTQFHSQPTSPTPQEQYFEAPTFPDKVMTTEAQELQNTTEQKIKATDMSNNVQNCKEPSEEIVIKQADKIAQVPISADNNVPRLFDSISSLNDRNALEDNVKGKNKLNSYQVEKKT